MIRTTTRWRTRAVAASLVLVLGAAGCGQAAPSPAPSSPGPATAQPSTSATPTAPAERSCADGDAPVIWRTHLTGPLSTPAQGDGLPFLLVGDGRTLRSLTACGGERAGAIDLDGGVAQRPVIVALASGDRAVFATTSAGSVYRVDVDATGELTLGWRRAMGRAECQADRFSAAPVVADDLVYVATDRQCGATLANQVAALDVVDGDVRWTFNQNGLTSVGAVTSAPVLDPGTDRLLVGTAGPRGQPTLYALNARTGNRVWAADAGRLEVSPVVTDERVFTVDAQGSVRAFTTSGASIWTSAVAPGGAVLGLVDYGAIDVADSVILVSAAGKVWPVTHAGVASPALALPDGAAMTMAALVDPTQRRLYVGSAAQLWQLTIFGEAEAHHDLGGVAGCGVLVVDGRQTNLVIGSTAGDLVKLAAPLEV